MKEDQIITYCDYRLSNLQLWTVTRYKEEITSSSVVKLLLIGMFNTPTREQVQWILQELHFKNCFSKNFHTLL